jgi:dGTPase
MYRESRVMRIMGEAEQVVVDLFAAYLDAPGELPPEWREAVGEAARERQVADFIAGMTDRYALIEHARLFAATPELR